MQKIQNILKDSLTIDQAYRQFRERVRSGPSPFQRAQVIQKAFPQIADLVLRQAREAEASFVLLPGNSQPSFIGSPPRWHDNPYQNNEYVFQISRMNHWLPMLHAYHLTGEERYAGKIIGELTDWIKNCPREPIFDEKGLPRTSYFNSPAAKEWRLLECGIRPYRTWCPVLEGLCLSPYFTEQVFESALLSLYEHCETVYHLSPLAWPKADHNHYLMENLGLLAVSLMFPELKDSEEWKNHAIRELCRCMEAQVDPQGAQIEGCPSYHNGCIFWFAMALVYGRKYGFTLPDSYIERFSRMAVHSLYVTRPCGTNVPWGDTSTLTGTLTKAAVCAYLGSGDAGYLSQCLYFYSYEDLLPEAAEQIWRMDDVEGFCLALKSAKPAKPSLPLLYYNSVLKQAALRSGWDRDSLSLLFACRSPIQNNHAHIDPCGFDFTAFGVPMVVDPGKYTYKDGEDRKHFKSMLWHNTLTVNRRDAWEYLASWKYGPQKEGRICGCGEENGLIWAIASHNNYAPVIHTRAVALLQGKLLLVIDLVEHLSDGDSIQIQFHIDRPEVETDSSGCTACWSCESGPRDMAASVSAGRSEGPSLRITGTAGTPELIPAKVSDRNDSFRDSLILQYNKKCAGAAEAIATVLLPEKGGRPPMVKNLNAVFDGNVTVTFQIEEENYRIIMDEHGISGSH